MNESLLELPQFVSFCFGRIVSDAPDQLYRVLLLVVSNDTTVEHSFVVHSNNTSVHPTCLFPTTDDRTVVFVPHLYLMTGSLVCPQNGSSPMPSCSNLPYSVAVVLLLSNC